MASINTSELPPRERAIQQYEEYSALIRRMECGERLASAPWSEPRFQELVNKALARIGSTEQRAINEFAAFKRHLRDVMGPK